jgi:hypothetical protein
MRLFLARLKVISTAAVTYLTMIAVVLTIVVDELADTIDMPAVVAVIAKIISGIGVAVAIIRRVTPVIVSERGILPNGEAQP